ncbi:hypothetical protein [Actinacidiphila acidipaludis]|uniref:Uncharacterized protein n=1 Tax=Actinacidiphila acidipaludis TaxID=2873382 RepID=A0ABS7QFE5_9ACTN|nr:hypothetical protein [Streptomyces acidipaludis]MBY8881419.1 hypothetical protein [Streptomyces acidipaludis]
MPGPPEGPQEVWDACVAYADAVFEVHDHVPWQRDRLLDSYAAWRLSAPTADGLSRTLLALRLYALSTDDAAAPGRPSTRVDPAGVPLALAVSDPRQHYELFAGLDAVVPDAVRSHWLNILKLLTYEQRGSAVTLARLDAGIRTVVTRLTERYREPDLTMRDLRCALKNTTEA